MITHTNYFDSQILKIAEEIDKNDLEIFLLKRYLIKNFSKDHITEKYDQLFRVFPYEVESASSSLGISIFATEIQALYFSLSEQSSVVYKDQVNKIISKRDTFSLKDNIDIVIDFIEEYVNSLVYWYNIVLENTMKLPFFTNILDEKIILMNLLNLYKSLIEDPTKQLNVFFGITLTKSISNIIVRILIEVIEQRLKVLTIHLELSDVDSKTTYIENNIKQVKWFGTQQEFCELLIELSNKNWIEEIQDGDRKKIIYSMSKVFDFEKTRKNDKSDPVNSLYQTFKGEYVNNKRVHSFLERKSYKRKFNAIEINKF